MTARSGPSVKSECFSFQSYKMATRRRRYPDHRWTPISRPVAIIMSGAYEHKLKKHPGIALTLLRGAEPAAALQSAAPITVGLLVRAPTGRTCPPRGGWVAPTTTLCRGQAECRFHRRTSPPAPPRDRAPGFHQFSTGWPGRRAIRAFADASARLASRSGLCVNSTDKRALSGNWAVHFRICPTCPRTRAMLMTAWMALPVQCKPPIGCHRHVLLGRWPRLTDPPRPKASYFR